VIFGIRVSRFLPDEDTLSGRALCPPFLFMRR
jgi:hypothetical protein